MLPRDAVSFAAAVLIFAGLVLIVAGAVLPGVAVTGVGAAAYWRSGP